MTRTATINDLMNKAQQTAEAQKQTTEAPTTTVVDFAKMTKAQLVQLLNITEAEAKKQTKAQLVQLAQQTAETADEQTAETADEQTAETADEQKQTKKQTQAEKKEALVNAIKAHIKEAQLPGTLSLTSENFYLYKEDKATVKFQPGGGVCRIRCNNKAGELLIQAEITVKEHPNWNIKYEVITEDYKLVLNAIHEQLTKKADEQTEAETATAEA